MRDAPPAPGVLFDDQSTHSFVLSLAMNNFVKAREGRDADNMEVRNATRAAEMYRSSCR